MESNRNYLIDVCLFMAVFKCVDMWCVLYITYTTYARVCSPFLSWYTTLEKNAPVSCMDLSFNPGRWRHICQTGCEDRIYCLAASAQDEDCEDDDGTQGRPTLPEGHVLLRRGKRKELPRVAVTTGGCRTRKSWAGEDGASRLEKLQKWCVWNWFKLQMIQVLPPWTRRRC